MKNLGTINARTLFCVAILVCYLQDAASWTTVSDSTIPQSENNLNAQEIELMSKRDWNRNLHSWGKRAWQNLQGGWGKRDPRGEYPQRSAWRQLQGGAWGKRFTPAEDDVSMKELAAMIEEEGQENGQYGNDGAAKNELDFNAEEKRAWNARLPSWGKRAKWANIGAAWGKKDPAWTNLKGIWGKRSYPDENMV